MKTYTLNGGERHDRRRWRFIPIMVVVIIYAGWTLWRPLPAVRPTISTAALQATAPTGHLIWPSQGQSAVGVVDTPILETHGIQKPMPTASTAKLITLLTVLEKKPLRPGEQGPTITLTDNDVALYRNYAAQDGSLVAVQAGEKISEYQMLQAILLPSANNMADSLAIWAFGSLKNYSAAANKYLSSHDLPDTHVGSDASGLSPTTTSTARGLVKIGELVMKNPALAQIVAQPSASGIPVVGNIKNVNLLLGADGIVGIKTGNSDQAGGVFVSASKTMVNDKPVTIVTALAGSPTLFQAMKDSLPLVQTAQKNFKSVDIIKQNEVVGNYSSPWSNNTTIIADKSLSTQTWAGRNIQLKSQMNDMKPGASANQAAGSLVLAKSGLTDQKSVAVKLQSKISKPSLWWRLTHPLN